MPWARFEDDYLGNRKLATLSTAAIALDMASIMYSARELRDGQLTVADVEIIATLIHIRRWPPVAAELVRVNRWSQPESGGYAIHDYLEYQPSREQILRQREEDRDRKRRGAHAMHSARDSGRKPPGNQAESVGIPDAPVPGPGPGPRNPNFVRDSVPPPYPPPQAAGVVNLSTNGSCCILAEFTSGRKHHDSCPVGGRL